MNHASLLDAIALDVLVLGGGAAGICAAVAARRAGATKVVVLKKAEGATAMSSGAVDVADGDRALLPTPSRHAFHAGMSIEESIERLAAATPRHPYARVPVTARERMPDALSLLQHAAAGLPFTAGSEGRNVVVATQLGTVKRTALTQASLAYDLSRLPPGGRVLVVELEDVAGFDGEPVAAMLRWIDGLATAPPPHIVKVVSIPPLSPERTYASPRHFAASLRHEGRAAFVEHLVTHLRRAAATCGADVAFLPPVLGLDEGAGELSSSLASRCGIPVVELLALPQSAPGTRLSAALERGARDAEVEVLRGDATGAVITGHRVTEVHALVDGDERRFRPGAVVLATGRFLAGGLQRTGTAHEPVFNLPVVVAGEPIDDVFIGALTAKLPEGDHDIFRAGIAYDAQLRPLRAGRDIVANNLFAAGSVLEGYDPARDGSGLGVAAWTGLLAGEGAAAAARE